MRYLDSPGESASRDPRIVIRLAIEPLRTFVPAVVDTAAPWCIFKPEIGEILRRSCTELPGDVGLSTRLGTIWGRLYQTQIRLPAQEGRSLDLDATVFLSPDWQGGNFVGYTGLLQRIRFAVDPHSNLFYFGDL